MRKGIGLVAIDTFHCFSSYHGIDDGFFDSLYRCLKKRVYQVIRQFIHFGKIVSLKRIGIGRGEGNKNIS